MDSAKSIFLQASKIHDLEARQRFVELACGEDWERLEQITRWLQHCESLQRSPLEVGVAQLQFTTPMPLGSLTANGGEGWSNGEGGEDSDLPPDEICGERIGPYEIVELLGRGGMGEVYLARQASPIQRDVALKLTSTTISSSRLLAHFEAERRALERMEHPGIARVLDAGKTRWGAPYFVMELVRGEPITQYCKHNRLSIDDRLRLFIDVCLAVQHAHHKGIVHRDLKPSNILVTCHDEKPVVKVIDFGIACAVDHLANNTSAARQPFQFHLIGTPLYMSPEQTMADSADTDACSDIYSLGVVLYELLTGTTPIDPEQLDQMDSDAICRMVQKELPPLPSARLLDPYLQDARKLKFELDWIVMKAIAKLPLDRYLTATGLANDVQRFLDGKPIHARPSDWRYRTIKWMSAYKAVFATLAAIAASMLLATIISLISAYDARKARDASVISEFEAKKSRDHSEALLFAADMKIASEALRDANLRSARERLERHIPEAGQPDRRNFAWHYLWSQLNPETHIVETDSDYLNYLFEIRFAPDGETFATGHESCEVLIWQVGNDQPIQRLEKHNDIVRCIAYSPNGAWLASGSDDGELRIWRVGETTPTHCVQAHAEDIYGIEWIDDDYLVTGGDRDIKIFQFARSDEKSGHENHEAHQHRDKILQPKKTIGPLPGLIYAIAVSPNRKELAVACDNASATSIGVVTRWDIEEGLEKDRIDLGTGIASIAYHPSASELVLGTLSGSLFLVDIGDARELDYQKIESDQHSSRIYCLAFSTDGSRMVSASKDATLRVWNTSDWSCEQVVQSHLQRVYAADFRPNTRSFASAGRDCTIRFFDSDLQAFHCNGLPMPLAEVKSRSTNPVEPFPTIHPPRKISYLRSRDCMILSGNTWDNGFYCPRETRFESLPFADVYSGYAISDNERFLVTETFDGILISSDAGPTQLEQTNPPPIDLDGDGIADRVCGFGSDRQLVWQRGTAAEGSSWDAPRLFGHQRPSARRHLSQPRSEARSDMYVFDRGQLERQQVQTGELVEYEVIDSGLSRNAIWQMVEHVSGQRPTHLIGIPDQGTIFVYPNSRAGEKLELQTGRIEFKAFHAVDWAGSGEVGTILVADQESGLRLYSLTDASGYELAQRIQCPIEAWALHVTRDDHGDTLHVAGPDGIVSYEISDGRIVDHPIRQETIENAPWEGPLVSHLAIYDLQEARIIGSHYSPEHFVLASAISNDGQTIATAGHGKFIRLWNRSGHLLYSFPVRQDPKYAVAFSPQGDKLCVIVGDDIQIFDVNERTLLHEYRGHDDTVKVIAIAPNREILASASHDLTVRLWSLETGQTLAVLVGHTAIPQCIAFDPTERLVATADRDGIVKMWDIETGGELLELRDFNFEAQCLVFDSPNSLTILGWSENHFGDLQKPKIQIGKWTIRK